MLHRFLWAAVFFLTAVLPLAARDKLQGYCEKGGQQVSTQGYASSTRVQRSYASCTVTVYLAGSVTLATIYADDAGTPKANPFTAASDGYWWLYADEGRYDVQLSGGGISPTFTRGDFRVGSTVANVHGYAGSNLGARLQACHDAAPAGGWTCDARLLTGAQTITSTVSVSKPVQFLLGEATITSTPATTFSLATTANGAAIVGCGAGCTIFAHSGAGYAVDVPDGPTMQYPAKVRVENFQVSASGNALGAIRIGRSTTVYDAAANRNFWAIRNVYARWDGAASVNTVAFSFTQLAASSVEDVYAECQSAANCWYRGFLFDRGTVNSVRHIRAHGKYRAVEVTMAQPGGGYVGGADNSDFYLLDVGIFGTGGTGIYVNAQEDRFHSTFSESAGGVVADAMFTLGENAADTLMDNFVYSWNNAPTCLFRVQNNWMHATLSNHTLPGWGPFPAACVGVAADNRERLFIYGGTTGFINRVAQDLSLDQAHIIGPDWNVGAGLAWLRVTGRLKSPLRIEDYDARLRLINITGPSGRWWDITSETNGRLNFTDQTAVATRAYFETTGVFNTTGLANVGSFTNTGDNPLFQAATSAARSLLLRPFDDLNPNQHVFAIQDAAPTTTTFFVTKLGFLSVPTLTFAQLVGGHGVPMEIVYCSNCDTPTVVNNGCASAGDQAGAMAVLVRGGYKCF